MEMKCIWDEGFHRSVDFSRQSVVYKTYILHRTLNKEKPAKGMLQKKVNDFKSELYVQWIAETISLSLSQLVAVNTAANCSIPQTFFIPL